MGSLYVQFRAGVSWGGAIETAARDVVHNSAVKTRQINTRPVRAEKTSRKRALNVKHCKLKIKARTVRRVSSSTNIKYELPVTCHARQRVFKATTVMLPLPVYFSFFVNLARKILSRENANIIDRVKVATAPPQHCP